MPIAAHSAHSPHGWPSTAFSRSGSSSFARASRLSHVNDDVIPTWCSLPSSSNRPSSRLPTWVPGPFLCQRKPATTQSAVRSCLILNIARLPGRYAPSRRLAMTPSRPAPSNRSNQSAASARSVVAGVRWIGGSTLASERGEPLAALALRHRPQVLVVQRQQVPRHERGGRLRGEHPDPRLGRVDAQQQRLEPQAAVGRDHDLAVEHAALRQLGAERLGELRKVAVQRLEVTALRVDLVAVLEHDRAEAVPLRLEQPAVALGEARRGLGEHGLDGGLEGESHAPQGTAQRKPGSGRPAGDPGRPRRASAPAADVGTALAAGRAEGSTNSMELITASMLSLGSGPSSRSLATMTTAAPRHRRPRACPDPRLKAAPRLACSVDPHRSGLVVPKQWS